LDRTPARRFRGATILGCALDSQPVECPNICYRLAHSHNVARVQRIASRSVSVYDPDSMPAPRLEDRQTPHPMDVRLGGYSCNERNVYLLHSIRFTDIPYVFSARHTGCLPRAPLARILSADRFHGHSCNPSVAIRELQMGGVNGK